MDLLQLRYFCHAAQTENFSQTGQAFYVPATGISQAVKRLEKELGVRLFNRTANKITLNKQGLAFYEKISVALDQIDDAKQTLQNVRTVKLLAHTCRRIITQTVESFKSDFPNTRFVIHHAKDKTDGDYDFVISDESIKTPLAQKTILLSEKIMLACHKNHPIANRKKITANDIKDLDFIAMSVGNSLHGVLKEIGEREGFSPVIAIQSDDPFYLRKYLDENLGVSLIPTVSWRGTFSNNVRLKEFGAYTRDTFVWHDDPAFMPDIHKKFLAYLKKSFEKETLLAD